MHRHLIAGALACFGSSLFGQTITNPTNQPQGALNKIQNTLQNGIQNAQDTLDRNVPQSSGTTVLRNGQNRSSLNTQGQVNGAPGLTGNAGIQSNTNLQNNSNLQPGQLNSNLSTQFQGQPALGAQQSGSSVGQNSYNTFQSPQSHGQQMQPGQSQTQGWNTETGQNSGAMQNRARTESGSSMPVDNTQQSGKSQNAGQVFMLRLDAIGREFICVNGRPVYFDNVNSVSAQGNSGTQNQYRAGYGNYDLKNDQNSQDQSRKGDRLKTEQQTSGSGQSSFSDSTNSRTVGPINSTNTSNGPEIASPDRDRLRSDKQNESKRRQNDGETRSDFDAKTDVVNPGKTFNDVTDPKS